MNAKLLRLAYVCEFLLAIVAIYTAWSEVGGQGALDLMHWGWKLGFGLALAFSIVALTAALVKEEAWLTLRGARWLAAILVILAAMGTITYYYSLEEDSGDSDDTSTISMKAQRERLRAAREERNTLALAAGHSTPRPSCAYFLKAQRARPWAAREERNTLALAAGHSTPRPSCAYFLKAQRARPWAAREERNTLALAAGHSTPRPSCAYFLKEPAKVLPIRTL